MLGLSEVRYPVTSPRPRVVLPAFFSAQSFAFWHAIINNLCTHPPVSAKPLENCRNDPTLIILQLLYYKLFIRLYRYLV